MKTRQGYFDPSIFVFLFNVSLSIFVGVPQPVNAQTVDENDPMSPGMMFNRNTCRKDEGSYDRQIRIRTLTFELLDKLGDVTGANKWLSLQYGVPYTEFYNFSKNFGQQWYQFGLNTGAGYQAIFKADALKADLMANASARAGVNVMIFNTSIPVVDAGLGAGNYMNFFSATNGFSSVPDADSFKKWLPKINANVKIFGITVYNKSLPSTAGTPSDASLKNLETAFKARATEFENKLDEFDQKLNANSTEVGTDQSAATSASTGTVSANPAPKTKLSKGFLNFKRSVEDIFGSAIVIPIVTPLSIRIDFGVYFSSSLDFALGVSGAGFSINVSKNLISQTPGPSFLNQAKSSLLSNKVGGAVQSLMSGDFTSGDFSYLAVSDEGEETVLMLLEALQGGISSGKLFNSKLFPLSKEVTANVSIMQSNSAGAYASAAVVLDAVVATASAGIEGNLNLVRASVGGGLDFSSVSDYLSLTANGFMNLMSGTLDLFAKLEVDAIVYKNTWEWRWNLFNFPGVTKQFYFPIARMAYRGNGSVLNSLRPFFCIDQSFKPKENFAFSGSTINECDLSVRFVPDKNSDDASNILSSLLGEHGITPPSALDPCVISLNGNSIIKTSADSSCLSVLTSPDTIEMARVRYPQKFVSSLYDSSTSKPAVVFESFFNGASQAAPYFYTGDEVTKYEDNWMTYFEEAELAAKAAGSGIPNANGFYQDPQSNDYISQEEPALTVPSLTTPGMTNPVPVLQIGWLNDHDLMTAANSNQVGFCSVTTGPVPGDSNDPNQNCAYYVKAMGVNFPDGISCVSNTGTLLSTQNNETVQVAASKYDCASSSAVNTPKQVAACLLRKAFESNYCIPPNKANYIIRLQRYLAGVSTNDLIKHLWQVPATGIEMGKQSMSTPGTIPPFIKNNCRIGLTRNTYTGYEFKKLVYGNACQYGSSGCNVPCPSVPNSAYDNYTCYGGTCLLAAQTSATKYCFYHTVGQWYPPTSEFEHTGTFTAYSGTCGATIQKRNGQSLTGVSPMHPITCKDNNGSSTVGGSSTTCNCSGSNVSGPNTFNAMVDDFKQALYAGQCEIDISTTPEATPEKEFQLAANTCELIAQSPPVTGAPTVIPYPTGNNNFSNRFECKNLFGGAESSICEKAKKAIGTSNSKIALSSRFKGAEVDSITTCSFDAEGSMLTTTAGPSMTSQAAVIEGCDVMMGNASTNTLLYKRFSGISGDGVDCSAANLKINFPAYCNSVDEVTLRAMREKNFNLTTLNVYTRLNVKNANGNVTAGTLGVIGTCNLSTPPPKLVRDENGVLLPSCELIATTSTSQKIIVDRRVTTATSTAQTCYNSFQPYAVTCEKIPSNPVVKNELLIKPGAFQNGANVPLTMRYTKVVNGVPTSSSQDISPICKYGPPLVTPNKCDIMITTPTGLNLVMNGNTQNGWKTKKLTSFATTTSSACTQRLLGGMTPPSTVPTLGTIPPDLNKNPNCFGLSSQVENTNVKVVSGTTTVTNDPLAAAKTNAPPGGSAVLNVTAVTSGSGAPIKGLQGALIQMRAVFTNAANIQSTPVYIGSCKYNADGSPALNAMTMQGTTSPTLGSMMSGSLANTSSMAAVGPEITDIFFKPLKQNQFMMKVKYTGPQPPVVKFDRFTVNFPVLNEYPNALKQSLIASMPLPDATSPCSGTFGMNYSCRLPIENEELVIGPFPISFISNCNDLSKVRASTSVVYPVGTALVYQVPVNKDFIKTMTGITQCGCTMPYLLNDYPFLALKSSSPDDFNRCMSNAKLLPVPQSYRCCSLSAVSLPYSTPEPTATPTPSKIAIDPLMNIVPVPTPSPSPSPGCAPQSTPPNLVVQSVVPLLNTFQITFSNLGGNACRTPVFEYQVKSGSGGIAGNPITQYPYFLAGHTATIQYMSTFPLTGVDCSILSGPQPATISIKVNPTTGTFQNFPVTVNCPAASPTPSPTPGKVVGSAIYLNDPTPTPSPSPSSAPVTNKILAPSL